MDVTTSNRNLDDLNPKVKELALALIEACKKQGIAVGISETYRTVERQDYLYAQGRTRSGNVVTNVKGSELSSYHQWRLAFDVYNNVKGKEYDEQVLNKIGAIGQSLGLEWGGSWKSFKDTPHFQYTFGLSINDLKNGKKPPTTTVTQTSQTISGQQPVDAAYTEAVNILMEKGIINSKDAWYPVPNTKYVEELIKKAMPKIVDEASYELQIQILSSLGIITDSTIWTKKELKPEYVETLIKRIAGLLKN